MNERLVVSESELARQRDFAGRVRALLQECIEGVMRLSVPLRTDISAGRNWRDCK